MPPEFTHLEIVDDLEGKGEKWKGRCEVGTIQVIGALPAGMASGKPSVGIIIELENGRAVYAETSLSLLLMAADFLKAKHGDPRQDDAPKGVA